ncbi:MAG: lipoprotein signal peptidase [Epsilonproteobacteria bacterium]|nr:MAG: lipoprotein signal peptidase [Campylobacterota bacterium]
MRLKLYISLVIFLSVFIADQYIKSLFVDGFRASGECISLVLAYNKGVAFSMFAFLDEYLKYIQVSMIFGIIIYLWLNKDIYSQYFVAIALILGGGISNIYDRFIHIGVVDYIYWHCGFDFAIFNLADIMIDTAIVIILYQLYLQRKNDKQKSTK